MARPTKDVPLGWFRNTTVGHEALAALRFIGLRDRFRCPECRAVGTWKPHGGWYDRRHGDTRAVRRWMCKYCGRYEGPEGLLRVRPDVELRVWSAIIKEPEAYSRTPKELVDEANLWPWFG